MINAQSTDSRADEAVTSLERLYEALPKRRKSTPVDPFAPILEPKPKKIYKEESKTETNHSVSSYPLFDLHSPYFLGDAPLEPTDLPLVIEKEFKEPERKRGKASLPKIPSRIRWDEVRNL